MKTRVLFTTCNEVQVFLNNEWRTVARYGISDRNEAAHHAKKLSKYDYGSIQFEFENGSPYKYCRCGK